MVPRMALCEHELFQVVFGCAWWAEDVAYGSGTVGASTGVGQAAAVGSVAGLARFYGRDKNFRFLDYLPPQRVYYSRKSQLHTLDMTLV